MGNEYTEPHLLAKMKAVMVTTENILVNINNFLYIRQRLYLGRLKGAASHYNFHLPMGQTSYTTMIVHTLVQGLEDAAIAKDVMEAYATNNNVKNRLTNKKIKNLIEAQENTNRRMAELTRTPEEPHGTTHKVSDYHKAKNVRSGARVNVTSNKNPDNEEVNLGTVGALPNHGSFQVVR